MKKFLLFLLGVLWAFSVSAVQFQVDGINYEVISEQGKTVRTASGTSISNPGNTLTDVTDLVIPETVTYNDVQYTVEEVGAYSFSKASIKSVKFPNTVVFIDRGFENCSELNSVTLYESTIIHNDAFDNCPQLLDIEYSTTQKTITVKFNQVNFHVLNASGKEMELKASLIYNTESLDPEKEFIVNNGTEFFFSDLRMNTSYYVMFLSHYYTVAIPKTKGVSVSCKITDYFADAVAYTCSYDVGDAELPSSTYLSSSLIDNSDKKVYNPLPQGIVPLKFYKRTTGYYLDYWVIVEGSRFSASIDKFSLPEVEWSDISGTATSLISARLMAKVNLSNYCTTAGIEWRRYDAPNNVPSTQVACPIVDGYLIGTLRNLRDDVYYQFRPYVVSADGVYFYGEWVGFFTGDANVFFDPETKTYEPTVYDTSATFSGYALEGSDAIVRQGFEYAPVTRSRAGEEWIRIPATGIIMSATVDGLNGFYVVRSFVETATATYYGEELQFAAGEASGIDDVVADPITDGTTYQPNRDVYTIQGICVKRNASQEYIDNLPKGFYIIGGKKVIKK